MRNIQILLTGDKVEIGEYNTRLIKDAVKENGSPLRAHIVFNLPESAKERRYVMGGLLKLWVYLDDGDYKDTKTCQRYFEIFMMENFPEVQKINGKIHTFGRSSKGKKMLDAVTNRMTDMLVEQYGLEYSSPMFVTDNFLKWRDELSAFSNETFIEYAERMKWISKDKLI